MLGFVDLETRSPADRRLRALKVLADEGVAWLSPKLDRTEAEVGATRSRLSGC